MQTAKSSFSYITFVLLVLFILGCQKTGHYENGNEYLKNKQYAEALSEYQKVEASDKSFRLAQSKINYIQGLLAFNDSLFQVAETSLQKVEKDDEYYHDAQLMLDKISQRNVTEVRKDTVVVKHEVVTTEKEKEKIKVPPTDAETNRKYVASAENLINKFQSLYESAHTAEVIAKRDYLSSMSKTLNQLEGLSYTPSVKDPAILELRSKASAWMNKRIAFINRLISDNTVTETANSRALKEEGDKMYYGVTSQLKKVR